MSGGPRSTAVHRAPLLAAAVLGGLTAAQFVHTVRDRNRWPICSNNMFNRVMPDRLPQLRVRLRDGDRWTEPRSVYGLLPLEFFRVVDICAAVLLENEDTEVRDRFCRRVVQRLNARPWKGFDEVAGSERPTSARGFTGLEMLLVTVDLADYSRSTDSPLHDRQVLHRWETD
ncbi:hypothetical protein GXW83_06260 [Streptacidiphilus sp. PB12-B1b]|uniref:hypothetical protein n=1 Tax=Streptacidiphilus sp. PB12-B1b TaxID=2705012 RepID=UPI0015FDE3AD|nr:hypothetical protein [Streptacidiphilus sp. PB12-B1b]QMU75411.1 hypothetical protein GXW83_06260 [Streptacidiphilus sp. PB12-B1b]